MTIKEAKKKFMDRVNKLGPDDCWEWRGCREKSGYGKLDRSPLRSLLAVGKRAHRQSYRLFKGPIPEGLLVLHTCDNPACVNPNHLWLGTWADNVHDMLRKGRINPACGEKHGTKTHPETVRGKRIK